jgi:hypothetical protein
MQLALWSLFSLRGAYLGEIKKKVLDLVEDDSGPGSGAGVEHGSGSGGDKPGAGATGARQRLEDLREPQSVRSRSGDDSDPDFVRERSPDGGFIEQEHVSPCCSFDRAFVSRLAVWGCSVC